MGSCELLLQTELEHFLAVFKLLACPHMTHEPQYLKAVYCISVVQLHTRRQCCGASQVSIHQWTWSSLVCKAVILVVFIRDKKIVCGHILVHNQI
jgi:hypothetical protein